MQHCKGLPAHEFHLDSRLGPIFCSAAAVPTLYMDFAYLFTM